jgi:hypothetical protein
VADPDAMVTALHQAGTLRYPDFITPSVVRPMHAKIQKYVFGLPRLC